MPIAPGPRQVQAKRHPSGGEHDLPRSAPAPDAGPGHPASRRAAPRISSPASNSAVASAITSTARSKTSWLWAAGARNPDTLRTY